MIRVYCRGRLGNLLFQYAAARNLADKHNTHVELNLHDYLNRGNITNLSSVFDLKKLNIQAKLKFPIFKRLIQICWDENVTPESLPIYNESTFGWDPHFEELGNNICLDGYFQNERYFVDIKDSLKKEITLKKEPSDANFQHLKEAIKESNSVAICYRRGDFIGDSNFDICNPVYYSNAVKYIHEKQGDVKFFIFSDDIDWCKNNVQLSSATFVCNGDKNLPPLDSLELLRQCKHYIISNSTFHWWGAYLNESRTKMVLVPNRWFGDDKLNALALEHTIPKNWIKIPLHTP